MTQAEADREVPERRRINLSTCNLFSIFHPLKELRSRYDLIFAFSSSISTQVGIFQIFTGWI
jgi:hypothetical protein